MDPNSCSPVEEILCYDVSVDWHSTSILPSFEWDPQSRGATKPGKLKPKHKSGNYISQILWPVGSGCDLGSTTHRHSREIKKTEANEKP